MYRARGNERTMRATQTIRDAAILIALVLLATSIKVTDLPDSPLPSPQTQAAAPAAASIPAPQPATPAADDKIDTECRELSRKLTVRGSEPGDVVEIEVEIDPRLRQALGLCPADEDDPRATPADKA